jgi:hypothetical protein
LAATERERRRESVVSKREYNPTTQWTEPQNIIEKACNVIEFAASNVMESKYNKNKYDSNNLKM